MDARFVLLIISLSIFITASLAQENSEIPFPIEEECVTDIVQPSDNWTYQGTLLMSGYAGIHAMQEDWGTPRITAFFNSNELGEPHEGGQLSPDGRWYAVPTGETWVEPSFNRYWMTHGLRIYSTTDNTELNFNLSEYDELLDYNRVGFYLTAWTYQAVRWIDNDNLIVGSFLFNNVTHREITVEPAPISVALTTGIDFEVSPDWMRVYNFNLSEQRGRAIFNPNQPEESVNYFQAQAVAWLHDSSGFVGEQRIDNVEELSLFNRDGEFIQKLFITEGGRLDIRYIASGRNDLGWSPDDRYFAFVHFPPLSQPSELIILDMNRQLALNTCLNTVSQAVWSPYGNQVAFLMRARENLRVVILDLDTWTAYDVARHSGIGGALPPNMIGWRENN